MSRKSDARCQVDKQLSFALYGAANRIMRMHRRFLKPLGLTFLQNLVMLKLLETSPGSVGKIGVKLGIDTGTIVPLLKRMEQSGLISKRRGLQDERRVQPSMHMDRGQLIKLSDRVSGQFCLFAGYVGLFGVSSHRPTGCAGRHLMYRW